MANSVVWNFYKTLSKKELEPIKRALAEFDLPRPISIYVVYRNKTESADIVVFDHNVFHLMPNSCTIF